MKSNFAIVMSALEAGIHVKINGNRWFLEETDSGESVLCWSLGDTDPVWKADISLNDFYKMCNKLTETDIVSIAFSSGMKKIQKRNKKPQLPGPIYLREDEDPSLKNKSC